jgi:hypothetical protein
MKTNTPTPKTTKQKGKKKGKISINVSNNLFLDLNQTLQTDSKMYPRPAFHHQEYTYNVTRKEN